MLCWLSSQCMAASLLEALAAVHDAGHGTRAPVQALQGFLGHLLRREQQLVDGLLPPAAPRHAQQHLAAK
jgi:hypothetical protein